MQFVAAAPLLVPPSDEPLARTVLGTLARVRFASVAALIAFAGPDGLAETQLTDWTRVGLLHLGSVREDPLEPAETAYAALTPFGARTLAEATGEAFEGITTARLRRSSQKRAHDVAVGDALLAFLAAGRVGLAAVLGTEADDRKLATSVFLPDTGANAGVRVALQPDALVLVEGTRGPAALVIELDRGTTAPMRLAEKFAAYLAWKQDGGPLRDFHVKALRVLTIVPDERRLTALHTVALAANRGRRSGFLLFALEDDVTAAFPDRLVGPVARRLGGDAVNLVEPGASLLDDAS